MKKPNVLLFYVDQMRKDSLGCYGNRLARTPNIDALCQDGVRFDNTYVQNPVCSPSRMSMLSGMYCNQLGVGTNGVAYPIEKFPILPAYLKSYGYHTANIGKLHFTPNETRDHKDIYPAYRELGFDYFVSTESPDCDDCYKKWLERQHPEQCAAVILDNNKFFSEFNIALDGGKEQRKDAINVWHAKEFISDSSLTQSAFIAEESIRYLDTQGTDAPFFMISSFYAPHELVNPPITDDYLDPSLLAAPIQACSAHGQSILSQLSKDDWKKVRKYYQYLVNHVDTCIGRVIDALKEKGLYDDTLILFTSDHGEYLGDYGRLGKGMPGHDCIINMPLIMSCPKMKKRIHTFTGITEAVDILPTILDLCGIPIPNRLAGNSLQETIEGTPPPDKAAAIIEMFDDNENYSISVRNKRYLLNVTASGQHLLYDCTEDPMQIHNCYDERPNIVADLSEALIHHLMKGIKSCPKTAAY